MIVKPYFICDWCGRNYNKGRDEDYNCDNDFCCMKCEKSYKKDVNGGLNE